MKLSTTLVKGLIRAYQLLVSPVMAPSCRYHPSCSAYALEAVSRFGALGGGWLALKRILSCHPWGGCGYDPVPAPDCEGAPARNDSPIGAR